MCFLICFVPFLAHLLENDPKPETPAGLANWTSPYVSFRFTLLHVPPHDIINSGGTVR